MLTQRTSLLIVFILVFSLINAATTFKKQQNTIAPDSKINDNSPIIIQNQNITLNQSIDNSNKNITNERPILVDNSNVIVAAPINNQGANLTNNAPIVIDDSNVTIASSINNKNANLTNTAPITVIDSNIIVKAPIDNSNATLTTTVPLNIINSNVTYENGTNATFVNKVELDSSNSTITCGVVNCSCLNLNDNASILVQNNNYCPSELNTCFNNYKGQCKLNNGVCAFDYNNTDFTTCLNNNAFCVKKGGVEKECVQNDGIKELVSNFTLNFTQCYDRSNCLVGLNGDCDFTPQLPLYMCLSAYGYFQYKTQGSEEVSFHDNAANLTLASVSTNKSDNITMDDISNEIGNILASNERQIASDTEGNDE